LWLVTPLGVHVASADNSNGASMHFGCALPPSNFGKEEDKRAHRAERHTQRKPPRYRALLRNHHIDYAISRHRRAGLWILLDDRPDRCRIPALLFDPYNQPRHVSGFRRCHSAQIGDQRKPQGYVDLDDPALGHRRTGLWILADDRPRRRPVISLLPEVRDQ